MLATDKMVVDAYVKARVAEELSTKLTDQRFLVRELSDEVEDVVWKRFKRYGWIITLFLVLLGAWGVKSIGDAGGKIADTAEKRVEPLIQGVEGRTKAAQDQIGKTANRITELNALIDGRTRAFDALQPKLRATEDKLGTYDNKMREYDAKVLKSGDEALAQVDSLRKNSTTALNEIAQLRDKVDRQQKDLAETGTLVKELAARSLIESFKKGENVGDFVTITRTANSHAVGMRLTRIPYPQTVRVQWYLAVQPPDSYMVVGNAVLLPYWEDSIERFGERAVFVSYLADANPTKETPYFKMLSVKDNALYGDNRLLLPSLPVRVH